MTGLKAPTAVGQTRLQFLKHHTRLRQTHFFWGVKVFLPPVNTDEMLIPRMVCSLCLSLLGLVPLAHAVEFASVENSRSASCFHPLVSLFNIRGKVKQRGGWSRREAQTEDRLSIGKPDALKTEALQF